MKRMDLALFISINGSDGNGSNGITFFAGFHQHLGFDFEIARRQLDIFQHLAMNETVTALGVRDALAAGRRYQPRHYAVC